jgi:hypothetical protein
VSPFFGNKEKKVEQQAAGSAEVERLCALQVAEMAVELMPAFGIDGARSKGSEGTPPMQIVQWLMSSYPYHPSLKPLVAAVLAGLQALETAGLLGRRISGDGSGAMRFYLTPVGETALADGSVHQHLTSVRRD